MATMEEEEEEVVVLHRDTDLTQFLCDELIMEILIKLPMKVLIISKCVSKRFQCLISEQTFLSRVVTRNKKLPPLITGFFYNNYNDGKLNFHTDFPNDDTNALKCDLSFLRCKSNQHPVNVVASDSGLLLCAREKKGTNCIHYIVCNPFTKQCLELPQLSWGPSKCAVLFCYDNEEGSNKGREIEFKVLYFRCFGDDLLEIDIYSSEKGKWEESKIPNLLGFNYRLVRATLFDGSIYLWDYCEYIKKIYAYDVKKESVRSIPLPPACLFGASDLLIGVAAGSLYLSYEYYDFSFLVWVLVDGDRWSLMHRLKHGLIENYPETLKSPLAFHPLSCDLFLGWSGCAGALLCRMDSQKVELIANLYYNLDFKAPKSVIPWYLPAWIPCLKSA
ncbi:hypothetical protein IFM89_033553 [Coptis chinensis]|uniref:F-box domain-containing protein n=1 Tax=Coptis chinensis TaxID=261450 RepID=A0A835HCY1_9MAGN|nr:hypothetical protein IFM89_033553 [Coptis chinensis]